jgi:malic enzyme
VDRFVQAVRQELPRTCLQWEDFATPNARPLLVRYQNELLTFNDDVQGTAAIVLGAVVGASKVARKSIKEHQIVFVGAGSAAIGVATTFALPSLKRVFPKMKPVLAFGSSTKTGCWTAIAETSRMSKKRTPELATKSRIGPECESEALRREVVESRWTPEYTAYDA